MTNRFLGRSWRIKPRLFIMLLLLLALIFAGVFIAFNVFINSYIRSTMQTQLDALTKNTRPIDAMPGHMGDMPRPGIADQPKSPLGPRGDVISVNADYELLLRDDRYRSETQSELSDLVAALKEKEVDLASSEFVVLKTEHDTYYIATLADTASIGDYLVYYVSVGGLFYLVRTVNLSLIILFTLALLISFAIANKVAGSVSTPIEALTGFARDIGDNRYEPQSFQFQDVEFAELATAMNETAIKLGNYDQDQRAFFQNASHELRTPLQSIRSHAEGIEYGVMEPKASSQIIMDESDRLSALVEDLLYISRVDSITDPFPMETADIRNTLSRAADRLRTLAGQKQITFDFQFAETSVLATYNEKHMERALMNLLTNALRYANKTVILSCQNRDSGAVIEVKDDGPGVAAEDQPHIFERFYKGQRGKHGIGLSIVKTVVERHGGTVTYEDADGACFRMTLPTP